MNRRKLKCAQQRTQSASESGVRGLQEESHAGRGKASVTASIHSGRK
jgi:hypothetical protein